MLEARNAFHFHFEFDMIASVCLCSRWIFIGININHFHSYVLKYGTESSYIIPMLELFFFSFGVEFRRLYNGIDSIQLRYIRFSIWSD